MTSWALPSLMWQFADYHCIFRAPLLSLPLVAQSCERDREFRMFSRFIAEVLGKNKKKWEARTLVVNSLNQSD